MTHKVTIRKANSDDWQNVKEIRLEALKTNPESFGSSYEEEVERSEEIWKDKLTDNRRITIIALDNKKVIGITGVRFETSLKVNHIATIVSVYVSPKYRGKGISLQLMNFALRNIKQKKEIRKITLHVSTEQIPAVKLYEKLGFKIVGELKNEMHVGKMYYNSYVMELYL